MLYILSGPDDFSIAEELKAIKKGIGDESLLESNTTVLEGHKVSAEQLAAAAETVPFLAPKRLVIVNGLLECFQGRRGDKKESSPPNPQPFSSRLNNLPPTTELVLVESQVSSGNPLYKQIACNAKMKTFPELKNDALLCWIKKRAAEAGGGITPPAAALLARLVGSNLWILASEIEKLSLYAGARQITGDDINTLVDYVQQASVFAMADAILEFKPAKAEELLQKLLAKGATPGYLLAMLLRQVRLVIRARELKRLGQSPPQIQQALGVQDFVVRKTLQQASAYSMERLKVIYVKLLETDLDIKMGRREAELAMNILALELSQHRQPVSQERAT